MTDQNNIQDELKDLNSNLPVSNGQTPFSVPDGYFEGLAATILTRVKTENTVAEELATISPFLASVSRSMPYSVPEGYFEDNVLSLPFLFEEQQSAVLSAIDKNLPYSVPQGYFDNLPQQVLMKLPKPQVRMVPHFARTWVRAAVAAVVGGIMLVSGYQYFNRSVDTQTAGRQSADTSENWVAKNGSSILQDLRNVSRKELDEFIETVPLAEAFGKTSAPAAKGEVQSLLKGISAKEIKSFLEQLPSVDDDLAIIN